MNGDIIYEIMTHLSFDLLSFSMVNKLTYQTYKEKKNMLLDYGNYRFSTFQHQFIRDLIQHCRDNYILFNTYNNKGVKAALIVFSLYYSSVGTIVVTTPNDVEDWKYEYKRTMHDNLVFTGKFYRSHNYDFCVTTEISHAYPLHYNKILYKNNTHKLINLSNFIAINVLVQCNKLIEYDVQPTNITKYIISNHITSLLNQIHYNYKGPYLVIDSTLREDIPVYNKHTVIRPNTFYMTTYKKFISDKLNYHAFKTIVLLYPTLLPLSRLYFVEEKLKTVNHRYIIKVIHKKEEQFVSSSLIHMSSNYNIKSNVPLSTTSYISTITKLLSIYGDDLYKIPNTVFVELRYGKYLEDIMRDIDTYLLNI